MTVGALAIGLAVIECDILPVGSIRMTGVTIADDVSMSTVIRF